MNNIEVEIQRCQQLEKALSDRGLSSGDVAIRRNALQWAMAQLNQKPAAPAAPPAPAAPASRKK